MIIKACSIITGLGVLVFLIYSQFSFPTSDDWSYGLMAKEIGAWNTMLYFYDEFHGRYFSNFFIGWLMSFDDFLLAFHAYFIFIYSILWLGTCLMVKNLESGTNKLNTIFFTNALFIIFLFNLPDKSDLYFWLSGNLNYIGGSAFSVLSCGLLLTGVKTPSQVLSTLFIALSIMATVAAIGCNEVTSILLPVTLGLGCAFCFLYHRKALLKSFIVFISSAISFLFSALAPGHSHRQSKNAEMLNENTLSEVVVNSLQDFISLFFGDVLFSIPFFCLLLALTIILTQLRATNRPTVSWNFFFFTFIVGCSSIFFCFFIVRLKYFSPLPGRAVAVVQIATYLFIVLLVHLAFQAVKEPTQIRIKSLTENYKFRLRKVERLLVLLVALNLSVIFTAIFLIEIPKAITYKREQNIRLNKIYAAQKSSKKASFDHLTYKPLYLDLWDFEDGDEFSFRSSFIKYFGLTALTMNEVMPKDFSPLAFSELDSEKLVSGTARWEISIAGISLGFVRQNIDLSPSNGQKNKITTSIELSSWLKNFIHFKETYIYYFKSDPLLPLTGHRISDLNHRQKKDTFQYDWGKNIITEVRVDSKKPGRKEVSSAKISPDSFEVFSFVALLEATPTLYSLDLNMLHKKRLLRVRLDLVKPDVTGRFNVYIQGRELKRLPIILELDPQTNELTNIKFESDMIGFHLLKKI